MERSGPRFRAAAVSLVICTLCVGVVIFVAGCPTPPPAPACTGDAECDDGLFCNGAETCANGTCQDGANPCDAGVTCDEDTDECVEEGGCTTDGDCEDGEFCDVQTGECVTNENLYETTALDTDFDRVHALHTTCTACHHAEPVAAGFQSCRICHADDPNEANSFKDVAHDANESGDGCRMCHDGEFADNCAFCHTALGD